MRLRSITVALFSSLIGLSAVLAAPGTASAAGDPAVSVTLSTSSATYGGSVQVTATIGSPTHSRTLSLYSTGPSGAKELLTTGDVDSSGNLSGSVTVYQNQTISAEFAGDDAYDPQTAQARLTVHARFAMTTPSRSRSGIYYRYHHGSHPVINMAVASTNPGRCVTAVAQYYRSHAWHTFSTASCLKLSSNSRTAAVLRGTYRTGTRVRVVAYFRGGTVNSYSAHRSIYLYFVR